MKKVLIALGIGCGVLLIGGVIAMAVLGYACKKSLGGMADWGKKFSAQQEKIKALDAQFSFDAAALRVGTLDGGPNPSKKLRFPRQSVEDGLTLAHGVPNDLDIRLLKRLRKFYPFGERSQPIGVKHLHKWLVSLQIREDRLGYLEMFLL